MNKKVFSINTELHKVTGVQRVLMDIHHAICDENDAKVAGFKNFDKVNPDVGLKEEEYKKVRSPFMFYNSVVIVHERKLLPLFWILNHLLFQRIKLVYVHHNLFYNHKWMPMPENVVAISKRCGQNMKEVFGLKDEQIHYIHNCVKDICPNLPHKNANESKISILLPARINGQKRQLDIVKQLKGRLRDEICIHFAGTGPLLEELKTEAGEDKHFDVMGYNSNIPKLMQDYDYTLLFSAHEGLPISLIEATMCGMPIICNDVGGNLEIAHSNENAFVVEEWNELLKAINHLPDVSATEYNKMCESSRRIYEENFTFEIFKEKYSKLINLL